MPNVYGVLPVLEALRAGGRRIERVVIAEGARHERLRDVIEAARKAGVPVRREPRVALDRLSERANHQGVIAIAAAAKYAEPDRLLSNLSPDALFILLDGVEDPHNLGAIVRTAECAGANAIFIPERRAAHLTDVVAKTSAGAIEYIPVARVTNLATFIEELKRKNVWVVGVEASSKMSYEAYDYSGPTALVFGGEGQGLHRLVRERCDVLVSIPMRGRITSLNVSVAVGVVLFEAVRQRLRKPATEI
ncbi:MAG TPA: 23S rRNA (guanosine(2251)-2'-O)-methyltransferase RlmB [Blastocatellia bacterium]|nr:23S rRNA (guanosine(2251)-2'-O)-methyltransferase RlmB [Blastocatellia bacterium]